jgi:cytochrome c oxidase subunit III
MTQGVPAGVRRRASFTGLYAFMASVIMLFAAFSSALIVRKGASKDWKPVPFPTTVWVSTGLLVASSIAAEVARRDLRKNRRIRFNTGWTAATLLGAGFVMCQVYLWHQLREAGLYINTHPGSAFFWVGTVAHALHLAGGWIGFAFLNYHALRLQLGPGRRTAVEVLTVYWHFLGFLWLYLLLLFRWFGK